MKDISRNRKQIRIAAVLLIMAAFFLLSACQELFTTSLMEGLQRDPSNLPPTQQVAYAEDALEAGDTAAMADIYDEIVDLAADDPEQYLLAADLAMGLSGISETFETVMSDPGSVDIDTVLEDMDLAMLTDVDNHIAAAIAQGITPTEGQYAAAAAAIIIEYLDPDLDGDIAEAGSGDLTTVDWDSPPAALADAAAYLTAAGYDPEEFDDIFNGDS